MLLSISHAHFFRQHFAARVFPWLDASCKNQEAGVRHHAVRGADAGGLRFVLAQQKLADLNEREPGLAQGL